MLEVSDEDFAAISEASGMLNLTAEELCLLASWAVARHARARGSLRLPIRLEGGDPIRFRTIDTGNE